MKNNSNSKANALIHESSPYLLQHAYNPVDWHPWKEKTLALAKKLEKPLLISIGYSACHWCHVMEKESFEDSTVASWMNENFICIKVDREERPDIDQIYMNAVQLMSGRGGWPLNCFATSDGKPFYGGTYFPKENWLDILKQLSKVYKDDYPKIEEYANKLTEGIVASDIIEKQEAPEEYSIEALQEGLNKWKNSFDIENGGNNSAPKFPMPNNYEFLLQYAYHFEDTDILNHLYLSLDKMANGGIYDQIGGGFARYSTDMLWKVPHFEKMLYDNAQLLSLYSKAYKYSQRKLYKEVVFQTIDFIERELMNKEGAFYSALDADSEGEEGKYYVWKEEELKRLLKGDFEVAKEYYQIGGEGLWEEGNNILMKKTDNENFKVDYSKIDEINKTLLKEREKRVKPGLDDKTLTSWNALTTIGIIDAYEAFGNENHLTLAKKNLDFLLETQLKKDGGLWHNYKNNKSSIEGFLEDYSFLIEALIKMYQNTFDEEYLEKAQELVEYTLQNFYDSGNGLFYYTSNEGDKLIARKKETEDNVIPSSNSSMAKGLHTLGTLLNEKRYKDIAEQMLNNIYSKFNTYLPAYSNWAQLLMWKSQPFYEIALVGSESLELNKEIQKNYIPNCVVLGSKKKKEENLELLEMKWVDGENMIYVCENYSCKLPVNEVAKALMQLKRK